MNTITTSQTASIITAAAVEKPRLRITNSNSKQVTFISLSGMHEQVKKTCKAHGIKIQNFYSQAVVNMLLKLRQEAALVAEIKAAADGEAD
ncbi:hypothetical protein [uncultured Desulfosarcina sp.]|uniref:hypothetical protein n=1 Tax=uncultured Desulfosarcina sp. TaxID=218289 RepID=UPI0029C8673E|nr:hypothetical protein [uncultured Desulfosarcina sp.]